MMSTNRDAQSVVIAKGRRSWVSSVPMVAVLLCAMTSSVTPATAQSVHEITIAAPDVIAVEVRDPPFQPGAIERLAAPRSEQPGTWVQVNGRWGKVLHTDRSHIRFTDTPPGKYFDAQSADDASGYGEIGGARVSAVYRKSVPYDSGIYRGANDETMTGASLKHFIYLKLAEPLPEGRHTIRWPKGILPDASFEYSSRRTRSISIRANQHGYGASDEGKVAYLALWLPGGSAEGAVDFRSYGFGKFDILDDNGDIQFSSNIALRVTPTNPERRGNSPAQLAEYPSLLHQGVRITRLHPGTPPTMAARHHGFSEGQRIWLDGFSGSTQQMNGFATVGTTTPDSFEISDGPTDNPAPNSAGPPAAYPVHIANRAGTYVFELDFSAWKPTRPGTYRIHVPRLGVSDPFEIAEDIWLRAARTSIGGLYNHRSGIALDGRFGFTRPASFRPDVSITVRQSKLPLSWSTNAASGLVPAGNGSRAPWITDTIAPSTYWGGYMDAGDWDRLILHVGIVNLLLDVYESAPDAMRSITLGVPKSSEFLDRDLYAEIDDVPDLVHEAIWTLDFFRRLQHADGGVSGGIESAAHPLLGVPSFLEHQTVFAFAPDHVSTYRYASGAAKLARILKGLGKQHLAQVYELSAANAWRFAERVQRDPETYYLEVRALAIEAGALTDATWKAREVELQKASLEHRTAAAAAMFRLTGSDEHREAFEAGWTNIAEVYLHIADGAWDYLQAQAPTANKDLQNRIRHSFITAARMVANSQSAVAYPSMKHPFAPMGWGQGLAPDYNQAQMFIRAHQMSGDKSLLRTMQIASAHILGANQVGLSMTTGLGLRTVKHPLHEDHRAMGVKVPDGITVFGWSPQSQTAHDWIFGQYWSPLPITGTRESAQNRRVHPNRFAMPVYEYFIEHPLLVAQQEYSVHQTIGTTAAVWLYLHAQSELERSGSPQAK